jgi:undecaprenyl-diphosphatase
MQILQSIILGIIQGLTEFLPVSSSGHLALLHNYFGEIDLSFDVMLHLATLLAVVCYFFKDIISLIKGFFKFNWKNEDFRVCIYLIIATIPAGIVGFLFRDFISGTFSNFMVLGMGFFISAMFLLTASFSRENKELSLYKSFIIGISQALAILPGISRSGSTTSTGILLGISKEKAIRFSFLLAIPAILGASLLELGNLGSLNLSSALGFVSAFLFGLLGIFLFLKRVSLRSFKWFALYCFLLGVLSLILYFRGF